MARRPATASRSHAVQLAHSPIARFLFIPFIAKHCRFGHRDMSAFQAGRSSSPNTTRACCTAWPATMLASKNNKLTCSCRAGIAVRQRSPIQCRKQLPVIMMKGPRIPQSGLLSAISRLSRSQSVEGGRRVAPAPFPANFGKDECNSDSRTPKVRPSSNQFQET